MKTRFIIIAVILTCGLFCKKNNNNNPAPPTGPGSPDTTVTIIAPVDPPVAKTMGFFLDDWQGKTFTAPATTAGSVPTVAATDALTIDLSKVITKVPRSVYGNNSVLWMGQIVTQPSLMGYIKDLSPNIIRAPAGSASDIYFWNGTTAAPAPADAPANIYNGNGVVAPAGYWFGGNTADWTLALTNYYNLLAQTNSKGVIT
ncbi:MAG TPA: hypothetical protein VL832_23480, partial [Puia sp.]|nr:hypothetical protein [Puia sp.]